MSKFTFRLIGKWDVADQMFPNLPQRFRDGARNALNREAVVFRDQVRSGIESGAPGGQKFAPHSALTKLMRGTSADILNRTHQLIDTIVVFRRGANIYVGVRGAREKIASIHEGGRTWTRKLTAKQRRFLFARLREAGPMFAAKGRSKEQFMPKTTTDRQGRLRMNGRWTTAQKVAEIAQKAHEEAAARTAAGVVTIPARPFMAPSFAAYQRKSKSAERRMMANLKKHIMVKK